MRERGEGFPTEARPSVRRGLPTWLITGLMVAVAVLVSGAGTALAKSPASQAQHLAKELAKAKTNQDRVKALEDIFRALHMGVRTPTLKRVVPGGKTAKDVYLYTDEVSQLADALGRKTLTSFDDLTYTLTIDGLVAQPALQAWQIPTPFTAGEIQSRVQKAEKHWKGRKGGAALYADVIRDLGLARHSDLTHAVNTKAKVIDPLQETLISLGLLSRAKVQRQYPYSPGFSEVRKWSPPGLGYAPVVGAAGGPCDFSGPAQGTSITDTAKSWAAGALKGPAGSIPGPIIDLFHGIVLGIDVEVIPKSPDPLTGEFGQNGPHSAKQMGFEVLLFNHGYPPDSVVKCGALNGRRFPRHGPVPGINVGWQTSGLKVIGPDIQNFGELSSPQQTTTNGAGIARFRVTPDTEYVPDAGPVRSETGFVLASADTLGSTGNSTGHIAMVTKDKPLGWGISWHQAHGYKIDIPEFTVVETFDKGTASQSTETWKLKLHNISICLGPVTSHPLEPQTDYIGPVPYFGGNSDTSRPDSGYLTGTDVHSGPDGSSTNPVNSSDIYMPFNGTSVVGMNFGLGSDLNSARVETPIVWQGGHAAAKVTLSFDFNQWQSGYSVSPQTQTWTVPLEDDTRCPLPAIG